MEPDDLELASQFCQLVQTADLFEYLGTPSDGPLDAHEAALAQQRRRMQSMQHNPKYREPASFLLRHYQKLKRVVAQPDAHLAAMQRQREEAHIPMLALALQSVMADGRISAEEEAFLRQTSIQLGISEARYESELHEKVAERGVLLELREPATSAGERARARSPEAERAARLKGADGHGWWDAAFTRLLLEGLPGGPGDLADLYCRTGLSAATVLPERPQIAWTGVDRNPERLDQARRALALQGGGASERITLREGEPDRVPLDSASYDYALLVRAMPSLSDTRPVLNEAWRVLRFGGRVIVVEPDGLGETFYFRGTLQGYNSAFFALATETDRRLAAQAEGGTGELGRPGLSIGPTLPERLAHARFAPGVVKVHCSHNLAPTPFGRLARRLRRYPIALAQRVGLEQSAVLRRVLDEVDVLERVYEEDDVGVGGHLLPLFLVMGHKEEPAETTAG